jgi:hypothetical protein
MRVAVYVPFVFSVLLAVCGPRLTDRLTPRAAAILLSVSAVLLSASTLWALWMLAAAGLGRTAESRAVTGTALTSIQVATIDPVPQALGAAAFVLLAGITVRALLALRRNLQVTSSLRALLAAAPAGELVVFTDTDAHAYAVPGRPGRIVVSDGMLRTLTPAERRVLLAHERSHLTHHHHLYAQATDFAIAANPLLSRVGRNIHFQLERWADEDAATDTASRNVTAQALARASTTKLGYPRLPALAFHRYGVAARIQALTDPAPRTRVPIAAVIVLSLAAAGIVTIDATHAFINIMALLLTT